MLAVRGGALVNEGLVAFVVESRRAGVGVGECLADVVSG